MGKRKYEKDIKDNQIRLSADEIVTREEYSLYLKTVRESLKLTEKEMGAILNVSDVTVKRYESGNVVPEDPYMIVETVRDYIRTNVRKIQPHEYKKGK